MDIDSYVQYKAMIICTGMHALLLMFELLACDKLQNDRTQVNNALQCLDLLWSRNISKSLVDKGKLHLRLFLFVKECFMIKQKAWLAN